MNFCISLWFCLVAGGLVVQDCEEAADLLAVLGTGGEQHGVDQVRVEPRFVDDDVWPRTFLLIAVEVDDFLLILLLLFLALLPFPGASPDRLLAIEALPAGVQQPVLGVELEVADADVGDPVELGAGVLGVEGLQVLAGVHVAKLPLALQIRRFEVGRVVKPWHFGRTARPLEQVAHVDTAASALVDFLHNVLLFEDRNQVLPLHRHALAVLFVGKLNELAHDLFEVGLRLEAAQSVEPGYWISVDVVPEVRGALDDQRVGQSASDQLTDLAEFLRTSSIFKLADDC